MYHGHGQVEVPPDAMSANVVRLEELGHGATGCVYKAVHATSLQLLAVKEVGFDFFFFFNCLFGDVYTRVKSSLLMCPEFYCSLPDFFYHLPGILIEFLRIFVAHPEFFGLAPIFFFLPKNVVVFPKMFVEYSITRRPRRISVTGKGHPKGLCVCSRTTSLWQ